MSSSLSTVVSELVRAQMGTSLSPTVTDEDLDKAVAELILKEAKKKAEGYKATGLKAYLRNNFFDSNAPRANKRFLSTIIKSTDDHNKTVLRAQAEAAYEVKKTRDDAERSERRRRAEEAVDSEHHRHRSHRSSRRRERERERDRHRDGRRSGRHHHKEDIGHSLCWDRWDGRTASRKRKARDWETWDGTQAASSDNEVPSQPSSPEAESSHHRSRRTHHHRNKRHRSSSPSPSPEEREEHLRLALHSKRCSSDKPPKRKHRSTSPWTKRLDAAASYGISKSSTATSNSSVQTPSCGPNPLPYVPSKMDRYFHEDYDPRLDVDPLTMPVIPPTGLISDADFAGWDTMLDALRAREDKKRARAAGHSVDSTSVGPSSANDQKGLLDIKYTKRGAVREWDMGKETPT